MLYVMPVAGAGVFTVIVPVVAAQVVGCVGVTVGPAGAAGAALIVIDVAAEVHPPAFRTVTLYIPGTTPVKIPVVFVYVVPSIL